MPRKTGWTVLGLLLAAPVLLAQTAPSAPAVPSVQTGDPIAPPASTKPKPAASVQHRKAHKTQPPPPLVLPPLPSGPLSQLPMDQIPATPAKVSYQGGMLTISAQNSTLGEILRDVRKLTGASIDLPSGSNGANERVVTHLGPGTPREVLVSLLNGSSFNYVMIGSNLDPAVISNVILTPKEKEVGAPGDPQAAANAFQANAPPNRFPGPHPGSPQTVVPMAGNGVSPPGEGDDGKEDDAAADDTADNADDQAQPGQPGQADAGSPNAAEQQPAQADPNQPNAGPKTPEQILEMLRRPQQQPGTVTPPAPPPQQ